MSCSMKNAEHDLQTKIFQNCKESIKIKKVGTAYAFPALPALINNYNVTFS